MERYYSKASLRSGKFVTCVLLVIMSGCSLLFWQDSKIVKLFDNSMANLVDTMQSMAIKNGDLTLLMQKIEKLEQNNGKLGLKIENLLDKVDSLEQKNGELELKIENLVGEADTSEEKNEELELTTENLLMTQEVYDNNGCKSNQYYKGGENGCFDDLGLDDYEDVKSGLSYLRRLNIKSVGSNLFAEQKQLLHISLSYNVIEYLPSNLLKQNLDLKYFYAFNSKLLAIPQKLFLNNGKLEQIGFGNNQIQTIGNGLLSNNRLIQRIWLYNNQLSKIDSGLLGIDASKIVYARIGGNDCTYSNCDSTDGHKRITLAFPNCECSSNGI